MKRKDGQPHHRPTYGEDAVAASKVRGTLHNMPDAMLRDAVTLASKRALEMYREAMAPVRRVA